MCALVEMDATMTESSRSCSAVRVDRDRPWCVDVVEPDWAARIASTPFSSFSNSASSQMAAV